MTSKPKIRVEMLNRWEDIKEIIKAYLTFLEIIKIELTSHCSIKKTREPIARRSSSATVTNNTYLSKKKHQF